MRLLSAIAGAALLTSAQIAYAQTVTAADNCGGAGTVISTEIVAKDNPDGRTLLIMSVPFVVMNALYPEINIDTLKDFSGNVRKYFTNQDVDVVGGTREAFSEFLRKEVTLWGKVVRNAGIRAD